MNGFKLITPIVCTVVSATVLSAHAYASSYKMPCGFYAEVEPFYVRATDSLFSRSAYATTMPFISVEGDDPLEDIVPIDEFENRVKFFNFDPENSWGFRVAVGYDLPTCSCTQNYGFSLEYTHFNHDIDEATPTFVDVFGEPVHFVFPFLSSLMDDRTGFIDNFSKATAKFDTRYNTLDLLSHKNMTLCGCGNFQLFAGARYLNLREDVDAHYSFVPSDEQATIGVSELQENVHFDNRFNGIGPRIGANVFYPIAGSGFGVTGQIAGNLLYGCTDSDYFDRHQQIFEVPNTLDDIVTVVENHKDHSGKFVPAFSGKVGLAYHAVFCNGSSLGLEIGYRGDKYFGVNDNSAFVESMGIVPVFVDTDSGAVTRQSHNKDSNYHDFDFSGPYLNITYHM